MREWLSWWSTTLPRSGPRVRVPSRALKKEIYRKIYLFFYESCRTRKVLVLRSTPVGAKLTSRALKSDMRTSRRRNLCFAYRSGAKGSRSPFHSGRRKIDVSRSKKRYAHLAEKKFMLRIPLGREGSRSPFHFSFSFHFGVAFLRQIRYNNRKKCVKKG